MTLDEALSAAMVGDRVTADHMQPGCYVEHTFSRGYLRCWPVDKPEDEPNRTQCDFIAHDGDRAADWRVLEAPKPAPKPNPWATPVTLPEPQPARIKAKMGGVRAGKSAALEMLSNAKAADQVPIKPANKWGGPA